MEDAIEEQDVLEAEITTLYLLNKLAEKNINPEELPLLFIRVRTPQQFQAFAKKLTPKHLRYLTGFNFPKCNSTNAVSYFETLKQLSISTNSVLYGLPILEDAQVMYKETRLQELEKLSHIFEQYNSYILGLRVGGTDFSSLYGLRRSMTTTIYDIKVVSDALTDILNYFSRTPQGYVISGPVWEYFSWSVNSPEIQGLLKELDLDIQNGFHGKTIIHPSQINPVSKRFIVSYAEYKDAKSIVEAAEKSATGVFKSTSANQMCEVSPHLAWAKKILAKAEVFGVADESIDVHTL
jgi:citrate lyase beta subunit